MSDAGKPLNRAVAALNSLLSQASAINLKEIGVGWPVADSRETGREIDILAHVEVFGRSHTVACQVSSGSGAENVRTALKHLREQIAFLPGKVTPIVILPVLSPEVQALCEQESAGCLDIHGNARLAIDEIFISTRSLPHCALHRGSTTAQMAEAGVDERALRAFPPIQATRPNRAASSSGQIPTR